MNWVYAVAYILLVAGAFLLCLKLIAYLQGRPLR